MTDKQCEELFLDWYNNFITVAALADWYQISEDAALDIINRGRIIYNNNATGVED